MLERLHRKMNYRETLEPCEKLDHSPLLLSPVGIAASAASGNNLKYSRDGGRQVFFQGSEKKLRNLFPSQDASCYHHSMDSSHDTRPVVPVVILILLFSFVSVSCMTNRTPDVPEPEFIEAEITGYVEKPSVVMADDSVPIEIPYIPEAIPPEVLELIEETEASGNDPVSDGPAAEEEIFWDPLADQEAEIRTELSPVEDPEPVIGESLPDTVADELPVTEESETGDGWSWIVSAPEGTQEEPGPGSEMPADVSVEAADTESADSPDSPPEKESWFSILSGQAVSWIVIDIAVIAFGVLSIVIAIAVRRSRRRKKNHDKTDYEKPETPGNGKQGNWDDGSDPLMNALLSGGFDPIPDDNKKGDAG